MKFNLFHARMLVLTGSALGVLLRIWFVAVGTDEKGLYPARHISWILLCILSACVLAGLWWLTRLSDNDKNDCPNTKLALPGSVIGGIGLMVGGISTLTASGLLHTVSGCLAIGSALVLWLSAGFRFMGKKFPLPAHLLPCLFFAISLFRFSQIQGSEPEIARYLFQFFAQITMIPACYSLWGYDVELGQYKARMFWCMSALYCNLVVVIGSDQWFFYLCMAAWMFSTMPAFHYDSKRLRQPAAVAVEQTPPEKPDMTENVVADVANHTPAVADIDHILEQILKEYGQDSAP